VGHTTGLGAVRIFGQYLVEHTFMGAYKMAGNDKNIYPVAE
jgi:hypothetical protein